MNRSFAVLLSFPLRCVVGEGINFSFPRNHIFKALSKSIYGTASKQNLTCSMTQDPLVPLLYEKDAKPQAPHYYQPQFWDS